MIPETLRWDFIPHRDQIRAAMACVGHDPAYWEIDEKCVVVQCKTCGTNVSYYHGLDQYYNVGVPCTGVRQWG